MKEIRFVDVGEGITEGHIQKWLVNDGDAVKEDQSIFEVETDKAVVNMPAPIDGYVKIVAKAGTIVHLGDTVAFVGTKEELAAAVPQQAAQQAPAAPPSPPPVQQTQQLRATQPPVQPQAAPAQQPATPTSTQPAAQPAPAQQKEVMATPFVRKLAHDLNVDISKVTGTGPNGMVIETDVRNYKQQPAAPSQQPATPAQAVAQTVAQPRTAPKLSTALEEKHKGEIERIPMSMTRKAIARNMEASWTIPRATHMDLINATELFGIVAKEKPKIEKEMDIHLTFLPFIIKATIAAIKENPNFNASYDGDKSEIVRKNYYNIGLAAASPDGLKVVVIKNADKKTLVQIAKEIQELGAKAKDRTITLDEMSDSTFTITNIGSLGGGYLAVPMINYPNVAILGILKIRDTPIVEDGQIKIGKIMPFSLVFDHRVVDGAEAVMFGNTLIKYLEDPDLLEMV
jgi:pyruvate dehydrogenase E2 component (dihydrolipoamide acetyltransferase)